MHRAANVMMNTGWENEDPDSHERFYQAISNVLNPPQPNNAGLQSLAWVVNRDNAREAGFHAALHGLFYTCDNPARVVSEFQVGGGGKLDLVLSRAIGRMGGTHPIGTELKFAATEADVQNREEEADEQVEGYLQSRGFDRITDGDKMVFSYAVFNDQAPAPAQNVPNTLIAVSNVLRIKDNLGIDTVDDFPYR
ncbi:hypothetical protein [Wolbachia endosymbiont (group A) of Endotricha flammealis]|uniref:hypothetical protein n=1 Tax=Wolbachia endosymbiont (group A) of Endotricha flammealis TaxID=2954004 RepID=UPI00223195C4|nr:hypothetical protein [Wolbachia endosymbiont (group A) of Endotricha flammealis]